MLGSWVATVPECDAAAIPILPIPGWPGTTAADQMRLSTVRTEADARAEPLHERRVNRIAERKRATAKICSDADSVVSLSNDSSSGLTPKLSGLRGRNV